MQFSYRFLSIIILVVMCSCTGTYEVVTPSYNSPTLSPIDPTSEQPSSSPNPATNFQKWTVKQILDAFASKDLEVGQVWMNDIRDLHGAPSLAVEFARFEVPSHGKDAGGIIFSFSSQADLEAVYKYHKDLGWYDSGLYYPWVFIKDNILLQINGILGETEAKEYGDILDSLH